MDALVTKKRLSDLLAYDWLKMIIIAICGIVLFEIIFTVSAVRLAPGQTFNYYYDINIVEEKDVYNLVKDSFSYDVIGGVKSEKLSKDYDVLQYRASTNDPDAIITDTVVDDSGQVRAKSLIDNYVFYSFEALYSDAFNYVSRFYDGDTLNTEKVKEHFLSRQKGDNRFRSQAEKDKGILDEIKRIENLKVDVDDFGRFLSGADESLFFRYTKFAQTYEFLEDEKAKANYQKAIENAEKNGRANAIYGLNVSELKGGSVDPSEMFRVAGNSTADNVIIMIFNHAIVDDKENVLQFETITFLMKIIRTCSDFS